MSLTVYIDDDFTADNLDEFLRQVEAAARDRWYWAVQDRAMDSYRMMARDAGILPPLSASYDLNNAETVEVWSRHLAEELLSTPPYRK